MNNKLMKSIIVAFIVTIAFLVCSVSSFAGSITLDVKRNALTNVDDAAGRWQYEGGAVYSGGTQVANYAITRRVIYKGTDAQNTAMLTMTIFFLGSKPPSNITLQGAHDFNSGVYIGSVSAASSKDSWLIGADFTGNTSTGQLTINWLGSEGLPLR